MYQAYSLSSVLLVEQEQNSFIVITWKDCIRGRSRRSHRACFLTLSIMVLATCANVLMIASKLCDDVCKYLMIRWNGKYPVHTFGRDKELNC